MKQIRFLHSAPLGTELHPLLFSSIRKGDEEEYISSTATDGDRTKVQAQQTVFPSGEAMGEGGTRAPSNISSLVEANLQLTVPANQHHSTAPLE